MADRLSCRSVFARAPDPACALAQKARRHALRDTMVARIPEMLRDLGGVAPGCRVAAALDVDPKARGWRDAVVALVGARVVRLVGAGVPDARGAVVGWQRMELVEVHHG